MKICSVIGYVVATSKHPCLDGRKLLVVRPVPGRGDAEGAMQLAVDGVGAGIGSEVIVSESGAAGEQITGIEYPPLRSAIVGIVD